MNNSIAETFDHMLKWSPNRLFWVLWLASKVQHSNENSDILGSFIPSFKNEQTYTFVSWNEKQCCQFMQLKPPKGLMEYF